MANTYFELDKFGINFCGKKYIVVHDFDPDSSRLGYFDLQLMSNRIWVEDNNGVRYSKNRFGDYLRDKPNPTEFMLVKLRADTY